VLVRDHCQLVQERQDILQAGDEQTHQHHLHMRATYTLL